MNFRSYLFLAFLMSNFLSFSQNFQQKIDSLLNAKAEKPFNGAILISENGKTLYKNQKGFSDFEMKTVFKPNDQFVIGSISKQITAVLVLQEYEKGRLKLDSPIKQYLPKLTQSWADSVTIHQLLTHTHGITSLQKALSFRAGTAYSYSQIGFRLLAEIIENTSKKSFLELSNELFLKCKMLNSFHPDLKKYQNLVKGYAIGKDGNYIFEKNSFENHAAAGAFISTAHDMILWNNALHGNKLLKKETYNLMLTKDPIAIREHPLFGRTEYGLGITIDTKESLLQVGQTGFAPGFTSLNFYFPKTKTSIVVLCNVESDLEDLKKIFHFHTEVLRIVREDLRKRQ